MIIVSNVENLQKNDKGMKAVNTDALSQLVVERMISTGEIGLIARPAGYEDYLMLGVYPDIDAADAALEDIIDAIESDVAVYRMPGGGTNAVHDVPGGTSRHTVYTCGDQSYVPYCVKDLLLTCSAQNIDIRSPNDSGIPLYSGLSSDLFANDDALLYKCVNKWNFVGQMLTIIIQDEENHNEQE